MKERPFNAKPHEVRAILSGAQSQFRRVIKPQPLRAHQPDSEHYSLQDFSDNPDTLRDHRHVLCPYGQPGDRLYVRETWRTYESLNRLPPRSIAAGAGVQYEAGGTNVRGASDRLHGMGKTRTAIYMPRWASRIDLEIAGVRVERMNDISTWDAGAEGVNPFENPAGCQAGEETANQAAFRLLWESISGADSWAANPWVWAVEFKRVKP